MNSPVGYIISDFCKSMFNEPHNSRFYHFPCHACPYKGLCRLWYDESGNWEVVTRIPIDNRTDV